MHTKEAPVFVTIENLGILLVLSSQTEFIALPCPPIYFECLPSSRGERN